MALPKVGAYAVVENMSGFNSSIKQVNNGIESVGQSFQKLSAVRFDEAANRFRDISSGKFVSAGGITAFNGALGGTSSAFATAVSGAESFLSSLLKLEIIKKITGLITEAGKAVLDFGIESVAAAARADEMRLVARYMGATVGMGADEIDGMITKMKALGIEEEVAAKAISSLTQENLGLEHATELVRIAQASAIVSGRTSSEVLDDIIYGITTLQPRVLRTNGIMVGLDETLDSLTATTGQSREELSNHEKQLGFMNSVIEKGAGLLNLYDTAMKEPMKKWRSLPRIGNEIQVALGKPFKDVFNSIVDTITYVAKGFRDALLPGGAFHDMLYGIGAIASLVFDTLGSAARNGFDALVGALSDTRVSLESMGQVTGKFAEDAVDQFTTIKEGIVTRLSNAATAAFEWGVNIVANLADGIISGAANILTGAMNFISSLLSAWLSPGSPPKVAPNIDKWGAATMDEYLKGFSEADFDILDQIQAPLKQVLDLMGRGGEFAQFSISLSQAIAQFEQTGQASQQIFEQLASIGGTYGDELTRLVELQFDLAAATKAAKTADQAYIASRQKVSSLTSEYNKLLKAGASKEVLAAKLKEINAAQKASQEALKSKQAAEGQIDTTKEQLELQQKLIANLLELAQAEKKVAAPAVTKPPKLPTGTGAKKPLPTVGGITMPDVAGLMDAQFEDMKKRISTKLGDAFAPLREKWLKSIKPTLDELWKRFNKFIEEVRPLIVDGFNTLSEWWEDNGPAIVDSATKVQTSMSGLFARIGQAITQVSAILAPFVGTQLKKMTDWFVQNGPLITQFFDALATKLSQLIDFVANYIIPQMGEFIEGVILPLLSSIITIILDIAKVIMQVATGDWKGAWETMQKLVKDVFDGIVDVWNGFADWVAGWLDTTWKDILKLWEDNWEQFKLIVKLAWDRIREIIRTVWNTIESIIRNALLAIKTLIETKFAEFKQAIIDAMEGIRSAAEELWKAIVKLFEEQIDKLSGIIWALLGADGPLQGLVDFFAEGGPLDEAISWFRWNVLQPLYEWFNWLTTAIEDALDALRRLLAQLRNVPQGLLGGMGAQSATPGGGGRQVGTQSLGTPGGMLPTQTTITPGQMISTSSISLTFNGMPYGNPMGSAVMASLIRRTVAGAIAR